MIKNSSTQILAARKIKIKKKIIYSHNPDYLSIKDNHFSFLSAES